MVSLHTLSFLLLQLSLLRHIWVSQGCEISKSKTGVFLFPAECPILGTDPGIQ